ncbi:MAG: LysR family transcriptional regulator [Caulobacteraceae bacterium]|nr:LysR family transcriptional regulator [Caulobacteraceae bacterium]
MELHQVRYFLALARSLNFTRAAEQCNVTQSALTKAVQKLEQELGGGLIHRERQLTQLTDLGKLVLPMLERAYAAAESARTSAEEFQRKEIAPLKIAIGSCVSAAIIESPLAEIARFMPGLQVELIEAETQDAVEMLLNGDANAAIAGDELGELPVRIDHWRLFRERFLVLMQRDSDYAELAAMPADVLEKAVWIECIGSEGGSHLWRNLFPAGAEPKIGHRGRQLGHLQHLVSAGFGLMLWPEHAPHIPSLVTRPIVGDLLARDIRLLVVAGRRYSPALEALIKIARVHDWRAGYPVQPAPAALEESSARRAPPCRPTRRHLNDNGSGVAFSAARLRPTFRPAKGDRS